MRALLLIACLVLCACSSSMQATPPEANAASDPAPDPMATSTPKELVAARPAPGEVDYACRTDADCAVKNVGNCCGEYPACVNADSATFPDRVKAECAASGMSGICGFPVIRGCQCVEGRCENLTDGAEATQDLR